MTPMATIPYLTRLMHTGRYLLQVEVVWSISPALCCVIGKRGAGMQRAWNSVAHRACGHIHCGLCLFLPWRPKTHCCLLPGTEPFIHEKCPRLKKQSHTHRSTLCIQKEINSTCSPDAGKSHRGFGLASVNCMHGEFNLCSFLLCCLFFWIFIPPCWVSLHSAVLCTDIHTGWKASAGPKRDAAIRKVVPKLRDSVIHSTVVTLKWLLYFWDWSCNPTVVAVAVSVETHKTLRNLCTVLCHIVKWRFKYCRRVLRLRGRVSGTVFP